MTNYNVDLNTEQLTPYAQGNIYTVAPIFSTESELLAGTGVPPTAASQYCIQGDHEQLPINQPSSQHREEDVMPMMNKEDKDSNARAALLNILQDPDHTKPDPIITTTEGATLTHLQPAVISQETYATGPRIYHITFLKCNHANTIHSIFIL